MHQLCHITQISLLIETLSIQFRREVGSECQDGMTTSIATDRLSSIKFTFRLPCSYFWFTYLYIYCTFCIN